MSALVTFPIDDSGPTRPARALSRTRALVQRRIFSSDHSSARRWRTTTSLAWPRSRASVISLSTPEPPMRSTPPEPGPATIWRSPDSVELATFHPSPSAPMRQASGTRAPSRYTSLKSCSPVIWISGRTSTPG